MVTQIIKTVISSAAEAKLGALYINCREEMPARDALISIGHHQPPAPMQTDIKTVIGVINKTITPRCTNYMDMRFHWLHDQIWQQLQFCHYWRPGPSNKGDYGERHHAPIHHTATQSTFLTPRTTLDSLRMCARALRKRSTARVC